MNEPTEQVVSPPVQITLNDGRSISSTDPQVNETLSAK